ncbi:hypothetical protein MNV49_007035 [Pseudohyphozyma bogoriensis]|nr:hypothetical protein MNV49_007035 [Pseudohyphozyma bogoriensis]
MVTTASTPQPFKVQVSGLPPSVRNSGVGPPGLPVELDVPAGSSLHDIKKILSARFPDARIFGVNLAAKPATTIQTSSRATSIYSKDSYVLGRSTTLAEWHHHWLNKTVLKKNEHVDASRSSASIERDSLRVGDVTISLHRTLRVPDNTDKHILPPGLGTFPLTPVADCTGPFVAMPLGKGYTVEEQLTGEAKVGGLQFDIFEPFDTSVSFFDANGQEITDLHKTPKELGLVAASHSHADTVPLDSYVDVSPGPVKLAARCYTGWSSVFEEDRYNAAGKPQLFVKMLTGKILSIVFNSSDTIDNVKELIREQDGTPPDHQRLLYAGMGAHFRPESTLHLVLRVRGGGRPPSIMGMCAGGQISQTINRDPLPTCAYVVTPSHRLFVHTVSPELYEIMTGFLSLLSPITPDTYKENNYPWFDLYSETPATTEAGEFQNVHSLAEVDAIVSASLQKPLAGRAPLRELLDPRHPPDCSSCADERAACVFRPCNHVACAECLFKTQEGSKVCVVCRERVARFVGFRNPVETRKLEELEAIEGEKGIKGVTVEQAKGGKVWTVMLREDRVSGLRGRR